MRIILTMVGVALGIAIAVVAGVYGWQQYQDSRPVSVPAVASVPAPVVPAPTTTPPPQPTEAKPKPVTLPAPKPAASGPVATLPPAPPKPGAVQPESAPAQPSGAMKPTPPAAPATATPPASATAPPSTLTAPTPGEDTPIATPETPNVATAERLNQLVMGMTEADVASTMGKEGVATPEAQMSAYTPEGWYEVRWPNADGSYIAALFNNQGLLVHLEPFNVSGTDEWMTTPFYVLPNWLNEKLRANNMPVRLPAVDVVATQANAFQFSGPLVNADGQVMGNISGTYYVNDPNGQYDRAMEGTYQYTMADGSVDANTFQFTE